MKREILNELARVRGGAGSSHRRVLGPVDHVHEAGRLEKLELLLSVLQARRMLLVADHGVALLLVGLDLADESLLLDQQLLLLMMMVLVMVVVRKLAMRKLTEV